MNKQRYLLFFLILFPVVAAAQYYNPYTNHNVETCSGKVTCGACFGTGNCYGYVCMSCGGTGVINCPSCAGYRMGQQWAKKIKQQRWNNAYNTLEDGLSALRNKTYSSALKYLKRSAGLGNGQAMAYIGNMYELGLGVEANTLTAKQWYNKGNNRNDNLSRVNLNRIKKYGFWRATASNRRIYVQNLNEMWNLAGAMSQQIINSMDWEASYSSSSGSTSRRSNSGVCSDCNGTGVNPTPNTGGSRTNWVAHYNKQGNKCPYCGGYSSHFHDRCPNCNVPSY